MGIFSWLGPLNAGKRAPWDFGTVQPERKATWTLNDYGAALTVRTLVHGPGATELLAGRYGNSDNSAVYACLEAIARAVAEPELTVYKLAPGERVEQEATPLGALLRRPNPHLSMDDLLAYLSNCLHIEGNAYWRKLRSGNPETGNVVELWPISPTRLEPKTQSGSGDFISYYRYYLRPGKFEDIAPENIVHFRMGIDDKDHRIGCAPLRRLAREVSTDEQATRYADRLLANLAINGLSLEFEKDAARIDQATADELKARITAAYGGDNAGSTAVLSPGSKLVQHGFSPEQMDMKTLHRVPEERIAAVLGVPAIVAGLGAGLDHATYSNVAQAREAFTETKLIPLWRQLGATLTTALVPDFSSDQTVIVDFNIDDVRALAADENARAVRLALLVEKGVIDADEARAELGLEPRPSAPVTALPAAPPVTALPAPGATPPALRSRAPILWGRPVADREASNSLLRTDMENLKLVRQDDGVLFWHETKAADDIGPALGRQRLAQEAAWLTELTIYFAAQGERVVGRLTPTTTNGTMMVPDSERTALADVLTPLLTTLLSDVHGVVQAGLGVAFQLDDPLTRQFLEDAGLNIVGITSHTRDAVREALIEGQAAGDGIPQLAARLRDLPAFGQARAETVARTELGNSQNLAAIHNYRASGVVVGIRVHDGDGDTLCAGMNGRTFPLDAPPPALGHPRCLVGGSMVLAPNVRAGFLRWFDGEVVVVKTAANDLLTCTPNHPILTGEGWVAAGDLRKGDRVLRSSDSQGIARHLDPHHDYRPAMIQQIVDALGPPSGGTTTVMPGASEDFHGDGADGEVYVVRTNGLVERVRDASPRQGIGHQSVVGADVALGPLAANRLFAEVIPRLRHATDSSMGRARLGGSFLGAESGHLSSGGLGSVGLLTDHTEPSSPSGFIDTEMTGYGGGREPVDGLRAGVLVPATGQSHRKSQSLEVTEQRGLPDADAGRDLIASLAGLVAPVQVVEVERRQFAGHVYNLETDQGWYVADNIITHNCVRALAPIVDASELSASA